jgi:hypothetical protein
MPYVEGFELGSSVPKVDAMSPVPRRHTNLRPIYVDSDFQCWMRQSHPKIGIILFFVRCWMRQTHPTLKIPVCVNRPLMSMG